MKTIVIADGNNLAFKAFFSLKNSKVGLLKTSTGIPTTVIFGVLNSLNYFSTVNNVDGVIIVWDVGGSKYRKNIFSLYKSNRDHSGHLEIFDELDKARNYISQIGIPQAIIKGIEADDSVGYLATKIAESGNASIIISDDHDYWSLKKKRIKIWRPQTKMFVTVNDVLKEFKLKPRYLPYIFALMGQEKDFIPGLCDVVDGKMIKCGFGLVKAVNVLRPLTEGKTFKECLDLAIAKNDRWSEQIAKNRKQIMISLKLMKIRTKDKHYTDEERKILQDTIKKVLTNNTASYRTAKFVADKLEFKKISVVAVLKKMGIENEKANKKESD